MKKTILVTGATSGIGFATACAFASEGHTILAIGRRTDRLKKLSKQLGKNCLTFRLDVTQSKSVQKFVKTLGKQKIDVLVNNAGLALGAERFQESKWTDHTTMIETNITALLYLTHLLVPKFLVQGSGHIVNIGSVAGKWAYVGGSTYCATKAAVKMFSEALRMDLKGSNIRVTNIEPGMVETEFSEIRLGSKKQAKAVYERMTPLTAEDVARSIKWCVDQPQHINISELTIFPTDQAGVGAHHIFRRK